MNNSKSVMHIAQPKSSIFNNPNLKSFMGVNTARLRRSRVLLRCWGE